MENRIGSDVFEKFERCFPKLVKKVVRWYAVGPSCVTIIFEDRADMEYDGETCMLYKKECEYL